MAAKEANAPLEIVEDDDSFLDWETRASDIPMGKHIIAGKHLNNTRQTLKLFSHYIDVKAYRLTKKNQGREIRQTIVSKRQNLLTNQSKNVHQENIDHVVIECSLWSAFWKICRPWSCLTAWIKCHYSFDWLKSWAKLVLFESKSDSHVLMEEEKRWDN